PLIFSAISDVIINADRPKAYLESICDFIHADAGAYWSNQNTCMAPDTFILKSTYNRPDADSHLDGAAFSIGDKNIAANRAFENQEPIVGLVGEDPFGEEWKKKPYTQDLQDLGITTIALVPIFDIGGDPIGLLSLYFSGDQDINLEILGGLAQLISATNEAIDKRLRVIRLERRKDRHETLANSRKILEKLNRIAVSLRSIDSRDQKQELMYKRVLDAQKSAKILQVSYQRYSFKERVETRHQQTEYIPLKQFLLDLQASTVSTFRVDQSILSGSVNVEGDLHLLFNESDLFILFQNLYINAAKYSVPGTSVRTSAVKDAEGNLLLRVRNDVLIEEEEDLKKIWDYEVRGTAKKVSEVAGDGIGLGLVRDICDVYAIDFGAMYEGGLDNRHTKVFCVSLTLGKDLVTNVVDGEHRSWR
ncbi:MAG: ATP-binding protein, partial [Anaerolineales bacterium]